MSVEPARPNPQEWLLKRENIRRIRECISRIQAESGVRLRLAQANLFDELHTLSRQSRDSRLTELVKEIDRELKPAARPRVTEPKPDTLRVYRGQVQGGAKPPTKEALIPATGRIYRGCRT